jgi:hypothetical protein
MLRYVENRYYHHVWVNFTFHTVHYVMSKTHIIIMRGIISLCTLCYVWNTYYHHVWDSFIFHTLHYVMYTHYHHVYNFTFYTVEYVKNTHYHHMWDNFTFHTVEYVMSKTHIIIMCGIISHCTLCYV